MSRFIPGRARDMVILQYRYNYRCVWNGDLYHTFFLGLDTCTIMEIFMWLKDEALE